MGRVLLIEDDPRLRAAWEARLRARGDEVTAVGRAEAEAARASGPFDLVIDGAPPTALGQLQANAARLADALPLLSQTLRALGRRGAGAAALEAQLPPAGAEGARHAALAAYLQLLGEPDGDAARPIALPALLDRVLQITAGAVTPRARVRTDYRPAPRVRAGTRALGQVFISLVVNAAQAMPPDRADGNDIVVRTRTDDDGWALVEVADTGRGIAPDLLPRIFDAYFSTKRGDGLGLGLPLARETVQALGGGITVESEPGRGATFRVRLPPDRSS